MTIRIPLITANWKMHKSIAISQYFVGKLRPSLEGLREIDVVLAPPFTALEAVANATTDSPIHLAAQNMHAAEEGAFTGEVSPLMLKEIGCQYVIVGHSERRTLFGEDDITVNRKVRSAFKHDLIPILCVGETLEQRQANETEAVLQRQLQAAVAGVSRSQAAKLVVAYEPLWAIGTGKTATSADAQAGCAFVRNVISNAFDVDVASALRVQYGGSVKPENARELLHQPDIDGALVGGASLDPLSFSQIVWSAA